MEAGDEATTRTERRVTGIARSSRGLFKRIYRGLVGARPDDPLQLWQPEPPADGRALRVLHVGDCGVRRMDFAHDLLGPPGYPLAMARELLGLGLGLAFLHYFCVNFEELPEVGVLEGMSRFGGAPDILLIQIGSCYSRRVILPDTPRVHQLRDELGRRAGRFVLSFYRLLRPFVLLFGRHATRYRGIGALERFVSQARTAWPSVQIVLVLPFRRSPGYPTGESIAARVESDLQLLAAMPGVAIFDANPVLGRDPSLRCVTGYNLNGRGSELVGAELASWLRRRPELGDAAPARHAALP
jgi:hypothetical protein